ncbi:hypothetical protein JD844_011973 [Phrynosoma platyrhinos]|uniref:DH domain-containing protein n=1 Tax=Phrynosoma platyrhinos TaxID=52577 RepID=A0ABQ7TIW1_PHRPL|nr:hypothetical protein JD844_011973 [Phrynosoma platyrhinos]
MANDSPEELPAEETPEAEKNIYETVTWPDKAEQNQQLAVEELINTEISYVHNLQLCISDIRIHLRNKQLFEVVLEAELEKSNHCANNSHFFAFEKWGHMLSTEKEVGHSPIVFFSCLNSTWKNCTLFQEFKEEMENVYKVYCANYDQALLLLEIYRKDPRLQKEILDTLTSTV